MATTSSLAPPAASAAPATATTATSVHHYHLVVTTTTNAASAIVSITNLDFMDALKIRERYVREAIDPGRDHGEGGARAARKRCRGRPTARRAMLRPSPTYKGGNNINRLGRLASFEPEGGRRAQVDAAARAMGLAAGEDSRAEAAGEDKRAEGRGAAGIVPPGEGGRPLWGPPPLFRDVSRAKRRRCRCGGAAALRGDHGSDDDAPGAQLDSE
jgi:hypothetical protein